MTFIKSNIAYILWFIIYIFLTWSILGGTLQMFFIVLALYALSTVFALSPMGEYILKLISNVRDLHTFEEKEYLLPIFEEVYENAKELYPNLNKNINIYINDTMTVNAFAIGRKTVVVTIGALRTFTEDELKGVIAHELGHIRYGHTKALLLSVVGNAIFSILVVILNVIVIVLDFGTNIISSQIPVLQVTFKIIFIVASLFLNIGNFIFVYMSQIILSVNSRANEFQADEFAYLCGYGEEMRDSLYLLQKISMSGKMTIKERLMSSHPHIAKRIENIENMLESDNEDVEILAN